MVNIKNINKQLCKIAFKIVKVKQMQSMGSSQFEIPFPQLIILASNCFKTIPSCLMTKIFISLSQISFKNIVKKMFQIVLWSVELKSFCKISNCVRLQIHKRKHCFDSVRQI